MKETHIKRAPGKNKNRPGSTIIKIDQKVPDAFIAFNNRAQAGERLAQFLDAKPGPNSLVLALPRGGVPVGEPLAQALASPLEIVSVRKLPIPFSPEAGFGAVALDGSVVLNDDLVRRAGLSRRQIDSIVQQVLEEVRRRAQEYLGDYRSPKVQGKCVYVVDDGLASGYSMIAAAKMVRQREPRRLILCVPVSPAHSLRLVEPYFDEIYCLISQTHLTFAVASFYADFHDLSDQEVRQTLERSRKWTT
jgi:putative phosphoribosyl transferase